jgi:hypothetical protein
VFQSIKDPQIQPVFDIVYQEDLDIQDSQAIALSPPNEFTEEKCVQQIPVVAKQPARKTHQKHKVKSEVRQSSCKHCGQVFKTRTSLGGHMSKMHPGMSDAYRQKIEKYKQNEQDREARKRAKDMVKPGLSTSNARVLVTKLKKLILLQNAAKTGLERTTLQEKMNVLISNSSSGRQSN